MKILKVWFLNANKLSETILQKTISLKPFLYTLKERLQIES